MMALLPEDIEALDLPAMNPADPDDAADLQEAAIYFSGKATDTAVTAFRNRLGEVAAVNALRVTEAKGGALTDHRAARGRSRTVGAAVLPHRMTRGR